MKLARARLNHFRLYPFIVCLWSILPIGRALADPCLTVAQVTAKVSYTPQALTPADLTQFQALRTLAEQSIQSHGGTRGLAALDPITAAQFLVQQAQLELEGYLLDDLLQRMCGQSKTQGGTGAKDYFPNTCAVAYNAGLSSGTASGTQPNSRSAASIQTNFDQLRVSFRTDVESLPACLIYQRSGTQSMGGYLLQAVAEQVIRDDNHDYRALLHGLAINHEAESACTDYPDEQKKVDCQIYLVIVAIDAALIVRDEQKTANPDFKYAQALSNPARAKQLALDVAGSFLTDLNIAHCGAGAIPTNLCQALDPGHPDLYKMEQWWTDNFGSLDDGKGALLSVATAKNSLASQLGGLLTFIDLAANLEELSQSIKQIAAKIKAETASGSKPTGTQASLAESDQAQLQQLEFQLVGAIADLMSGALKEFGPLSFPGQTENGEKSVMIKPEL